MSWTDERIEHLKKLWTDGLSASQIASELGGVTRNAVIGKVHRLGLSGRAKTSSAPANRAPRKAPQPRHSMPGASGSHGNVNAISGGGMGGRGFVRGNNALAASAATAQQPQAYVRIDTRPLEEVVVPMSERVTIMELRENMCRWPLGDPTTAEFRFCGTKCPVGGPYCTYHSRLAYQPVLDRRQRRPMK